MGVALRLKGLTGLGAVNQSRFPWWEILPGREGVVGRFSKALEVEDKPQGLATPLGQETWPS